MGDDRSSSQPPEPPVGPPPTDLYARAVTLTNLAESLMQMQKGLGGLASHGDRSA